MNQVKKIGQIVPKSSKEIKNSKIGLGFEKLDRDVFDPHKAYDKVAECGVKKARIQSGWQRTEKQKGVYDFYWIDDIVDNFVSRGIEPWICLCYGNALYSEEAADSLGAVGYPPIFTEDQKIAWANYVKTTVKRYKGKVNYFEVWNEPDGLGFWKHGVNPTEYGNFVIDTAKAIREADPEVKIIGGVTWHRELSYLNTAFKTGMCDYIDYLSFHEYTSDERQVYERVNTLKALLAEYNPGIELIQGESGSQSRGDGHGALKRIAWTEEIQAKQLARHTMADLITGVHFLSYFSCVDMIEAANGKLSDKASYLDYGYFGILGAEFDENGRSSGEYYRKPSYYTLQNICSVFAEDFEVCELPIFLHAGYSERKHDYQLQRFETASGCFRREGGDAFVYWYPSNIVTTSFCSSVTLEYYSKYKDIKLIDIMDGAIYEIPEKNIEDKGDGVFVIKELPIKDTPLMLTFGDFLI